jgi:hypothetical protein
VRFTLIYRGQLRPNGGVLDKQSIRRKFHPQLKRLWSQPPLSDFAHWLAPVALPDKTSLVEHVGKFQFVPLVSERIHMVAEIAITMLRPGPTGDVVRHGGDLDNRIKTLLDALRVPRQANATPKDDEPQEGESPFFCLLGDDRLVSHLSITTDSLLDDGADGTDVVMLLQVTARPTRLTYETLTLGS